MQNGYEVGKVLIKIEHFSFTYPDGTLVLRDVNAKIRNITRPGTGIKQGQVVAFFGPSGIGKTTLFNLIGGIEKPTSGQIFIGENNEPVRTGAVGIVWQNYPLFPHRTILSSLTLAAKQGGCPNTSEARDKALGMMQSFGLGEVGNRYPPQLSGGQKQRASILEQLLCSEHFLLMDEPFSGQDIIAKEKVCELIREVSTFAEQNTIIVVTHDIEPGLLIADRAWMMGLERGEDGTFLRGARIIEFIDLAAGGFAWRTDLAESLEFHELVLEVKRKFRK